MRRCRRLGALAVTLLLSAIPAVVASAPGPAAAALRLLPVGTFSSPVHVTSARDGSRRLFVVERQGRVVVFRPLSTMPPAVFLDIRDKVLAGGERGLLGLAFHPDYPTNGRFFVNYTRVGDGATVIAEYRASPPDADRARPAETPVLVIPQPFANHNGGMIAFGPDGFLYIGMGDGGSANDPDNRAQDVNDLLGKILRIDVNGPPPYSSPATNPFVGREGRDEIFALGFRNPWRFSFDRLTGQLYAGDVGQFEREEIDLVTVGGNYGWRLREGTLCTGLGPGDCEDPGLVPPLLDYAHAGGRCSVTGGYVYRGNQDTLPQGTYVFADFCSGEIWRRAGGGKTLLLDTALLVSSFGEDEDGEIYVVDLAGTLSILVRDPEPCAYALSQGSKQVSAAAQSGTVRVLTVAGCSWSAGSNVAWIGITSGTSGSGSGPVRYAIAANTRRQPRTGTLTIAGKTFTVIQSGVAAACPPRSRCARPGPPGR
jgi:hypothetical protein